ncbi:transglutaminaseTgpA domain-containing protein [Halobaculum sp. MBLA0147]|uniref:transglutaminaseTgpA domain-containing protein n=1 Tax=Halobaculum sp. MBLA0147 TaxID=3079934 RepID=UPI0035235F71
MSRARPEPGSRVSTGGRTHSGRRTTEPETDDDGSAVLGAVRSPPTVGVVLATGAFVAAFYGITDVVGGGEFLLLEVGVTATLGLVAATQLRERTALAVAVGGFALGLVAYFLSVPESQRALFTASRVLQDVFALVSGLSVLRLINAGTWAVTLVPGPTFLVAYLVGRRRHVWAATVATATTAFFVLTSDAGAGLALAAAVGGALTLGLAGLSTAGLRGLEAQWDTVAVIVAAMVVVTSLTVVGGGANPVVPGGPSPSVESSLVANSDRVSVLGSITLSPEVRFTVESEEPGYWRVGSYDRYTGSGWVRSGESTQYTGTVEGPPGESVSVEQTYTVKGSFGAIPALWRPTSISGETREITQVTSNDGFAPATSLQDNETYTVVSERPEYTTGELRRAGTDYPSELYARYTRTPDSTAERVDERTAEVLSEAGASTPYDAAVAVERYLESTKEYSLDVPNPGGNIAETFLFERDAGYCTYFATAMVTMLRTQGIPARFVTGYTTGQRVGPEEYVVRGLDSHAWVEVYFPDVGWVRFDPTPATERSAAERSAVESARASGTSGVDLNGSADGVYTTPPPTVTVDETPATDPGDPGTPRGLAQIAGSATASNASADPGDFGAELGVTTTGTGESESDDGSPLPTRREAVLGLAALVGAVASARRFGLTSRAYRFLWLVYQPSFDEPDAAVERAYRRLEGLAERRYRQRRPGETPRQYVAAMRHRGLDGDAERVARTFERAHYGAGVSATEAERVVETVDGLVHDDLPVLGRLRRGS